MTDHTSRLAEAFAYAAHLHRDQRRKGTDIPYITHVMAVSALVGEHGRSEDQMIAALLHDAVEDQGGRETLAAIRCRFGEHVAELVWACTDTYTEPKPPWRKRKEAYLAHIETAPAEARLISAADKLHNARAIRADYRVHGEALWQRFNSSRDQVLWYYRALADAFLRLDASELAGELDRVVGELESSCKR